MIVIGITGGIASGKSVVTQVLKDWGAAVLDADREGHAVLAMPEVQRALRQRWGDAIWRPDRTLDRSAIAHRVFAPPPDGPRELDFLERITHPRIEARLLMTLENWKQAGQSHRVVLDAALLHEAGWAKYCDWILFVDCPSSQRRARAQKRGWSAAEFAAREAAQGSSAFKRRVADVIIINEGSVQQTKEQIASFWQSLPTDTHGS